MRRRIKNSLKPYKTGVNKYYIPYSAIHIHTTLFGIVIWADWYAKPITFRYSDCKSVWPLIIDARNIMLKSSPFSHEIQEIESEARLGGVWYTMKRGETIVANIFSTTQDMEKVLKLAGVESRWEKKYKSGLYPLKLQINLI